MDLGATFDEFESKLIVVSALLCRPFSPVVFVVVQGNTPSSQVSVVWAIPGRMFPPGKPVGQAAETRNATVAPNRMTSECAERPLWV